MRMFAVIAAVVVLAFALACGSSGGGGGTGATCPSGSKLTYSNFGQAFMDNYCVGCHQKFGSQAGVKADTSAIDSYAGSGPNSTNTSMPKSGTAPTDAERAQLSEWLACGAP